MKHRRVLSSPRIAELKKKKRKAFRLKILVYVVFVVVFLLWIALLSRVSGLNIKTVSVSGNKIVETNEIQKIVKDDLAGNYFFLFPKTNFLIYPKNKIENDLALNLKRLKDISFNSSNAKNLAINVSEYDGKFLWCGTLIPELRSSPGEKCHFMDSSGYIFDEAPYFSGDVYFKFYGPVDGGKIIGGRYLPNNFTKITNFKKNLEDLNLSPTRFAIFPHPTGDEGNFWIGGGDPTISPALMFNMDSNYEKLAENLQSAIDTEPLKTDIQTKFSSLLYLDLRFGNKVYYKFQ